MATQAKSTGLSLSRAVWTFVVIAVLISGAAAALTVQLRSEKVIDDTLDYAVRSRTVAAGQFFSREIYDSWIAVRSLAEQAGTLTPDELRVAFDAVQAGDPQMSWIGIADVNGQVLQASGGLLAGADVSQRPWFRSGLRGDFAGDVHEAVLLAQKLRPEGGDPLRFVDLAMPVRSPEGEVLGVLGVHIDVDWVRRLLEETGGLLNLDLYLLDGQGRVVLAPDGPVPDIAGLALEGAARTGSAVSAQETWPDGKSYFTSLVTELGYQDLPSFGWHLAGRLDPRTFRSEFTSLATTVMVAIGLALFLTAVIAAIFVQVIVRPVSRLAEDADRIAAGEDIYPSESTGTIETRLLSRALARLQERGVSPAEPRTGGTGPGQASVHEPG